MASNLLATCTLIAMASTLLAMTFNLIIRFYIFRTFLPWTSSPCFLCRTPLSAFLAGAAVDAQGSYTRVTPIPSLTKLKMRMNLLSIGSFLFSRPFYPFLFPSLLVGTFHPTCRHPTCRPSGTWFDFWDLQVGTIGELGATPRVLRETRSGSRIEELKEHGTCRCLVSLNSW